MRDERVIEGLEELPRRASAGDDVRCTCGSTEFLKGPQGGLAVNLKCAKCGKPWWYAPGFGIREP